MTTELSLTGNNVSARIRAYVAEHPKCRSAEVAAALGHCPNRTARTLRKMGQRGLIVCHEMPERIGNAVFCYTIGRPVAIDRTAAARMANRTKPRKDSKAVLRTILRDCVIREAPSVAYNAPLPTTEGLSLAELQAMGILVSREPGFAYVRPSANPYGARY